MHDACGYKFTGKERDSETGLDYFGARYYGSNMGRFLSPDEFTGGPVDAFEGDPTPPGPLPYADITNPQSLNKYSYTCNNPLNMIDPDGHCVWDLCIGEGYAVYVVGAAVVTTVAVLYRDQIKEGVKGLGNAISNTFNSDEGNKNTPPPPHGTSQTQTNTAPGGPNESNNKNDKNEKKTEKAEKQSEPGTKKDTSLQAVRIN